MATEEELPEAAEAAPAPEPAGGGGGDDAEMPDAAAPSGSDSDSSDSDSDDEGAAAVDELRIQTLEQSLREQPLDYETHVQYIQCLRKSGNIEKLRMAREEMNKYFPLTPKMWQEWAKDEISLSSSEESFGDIEKLYERGVQEYLSIKLWRDYLDYVEEHDQSVSQCTPSGLSKMRNLFESAITAGGLHVTEGSKLWAAYREYEMAILITIADANDEEREKQVQRIRTLFHRQLSVPLTDMESTLSEYKSWEAEQGNANDPGADFDGVPSNVASAYKKANDMYNERKQYEDQLSNAGTSEADKLQEFVVPSVLRSVYYRATRNCTWVGELWVHYLLSLERIHASEEELQHVFERAIQCSFSTIQEYLNIYLTRVHGLRRRISDGLDFQLIRQTLTDAAEFLSSQLDTKELLRLYAYWAKLERSLGKDLSAARGVWENAIMKSGSVFEVWEQYISMEIEMGHVHEARSIYKRCYSKRFAGSGSEEICHSWIRFEEENGTLDDYDLAVKKVTPRLKELMTFKSQEEAKVEAYPNPNDNSNANDSSQKRKPSKMANKQQPLAKKRKENPPKSTMPSNDQGSNLQSGHSGAVTAVEVGEASREKVVASMEMKVDGDSQIGKSSSNEPKPSFYNDKCTVFVSNIDLKANEDDLRRFFSDIGGAMAIRLLRDRFTKKSRGLAYVDFSDNKHLEAAIKKNKQKLLGKKVSIARSDPSKGKKSREAGQASQDNLPQSSGDDAKATGSSGPDNEVPKGDAKTTGKNTLFAPRAVVKPLGWTNKDEKKPDGAGELKSNEEFRNLLLKK
ncbi:uncharacterized protein [Miscanthus floridulus]|uniref:uncharacterized protein isoform X2 n=1 Tax=Miscanthus floridulus TaxID=154761 RepID=UPI00345B2BED